MQDPLNTFIAVGTSVINPNTPPRFNPTSVFVFASSRGVIRKHFTVNKTLCFGKSLVFTKTQNFVFNVLTPQTDAKTTYVKSFAGWCETGRYRAGRMPRASMRPRSLQLPYSSALTRLRQRHFSTTNVNQNPRD